MADEAEAKLQRKAAKAALKAVAAAEAAGDDAEAKKQKKIAKKATAAAEAAAGPADEPEVDEAEAKRQRKAAKKAAAAAAAEPEVDEAEAKRQRKAAKKAAAAAAEEEAVDPLSDKKSAKKKRAAEAGEEEEGPAKKSKTDDEPAEKVFKVFIKGLPYSVEEKSLRTDFAECGEIKVLQLPQEDGRPKGFAFITFATQEGFDAAMKYDNTDYGGRYINVTEANGISTKGQNGGKGKDGKGKTKGKEGDWTCPKCGDNVFARNNACRQCGTERPGGPVAAQHDHERTVFIRGIPWAVTEEMLQKDFGECGEIENFRMPINGEGKPAGLAFIKYVKQEGVDEALKFNETDYGGRMINVMMSGAVEGKGKGKDGKGKGKDGKDKGKDGKGKDGKGKKGKDKENSASFNKKNGNIVATTAEVKTFDDSDDE